MKKAYFNYTITAIKDDIKSGALWTTNRVEKAYPLLSEAQVNDIANIFGLTSDADANELTDAIRRIENGDQLQDVKEFLFGHLAQETGKIGYDYKVTFDFLDYNKNAHVALNKAATAGRKTNFINYIREAIKLNHN